MSSLTFQVDPKEIENLWKNRPDSLPLLEQHYLHLINRFKEEHRTDAYFGLRRAILGYNPLINNNFEAFAQIYLRGSIADGKRKDAHFTRSQFKKFLQTANELDAHYKQTGERKGMDSLAILPFIGSISAPFSQSDDSGTISDAIGSTACMGDNEFALRLALNNFDPQEREICTLLLDGFTIEEVQTKAKLKYEYLVNILARISEKISISDPGETCRYDSYSNAARAIAKASNKENLTSLREVALQIKALPIYAQFSFMERKVIALVEGGMSISEIARAERSRTHIISKIWERIKLCLTEDGLAAYKARIEKRVERKQRWREWQLGHMAKIQKTKWEVFRDKYPLPSKKELKRDLPVMTIWQIAEKYHIDESNVHALIKEYKLEHIRNGKRVLTAEGRASRERYQKEKWDRGRPPKEEFAKDLQEMDWAQLSAKYGRSKYALTKYAKEMEIFHLKCDRDYEKARLGGIRGMAALKKKLADQYGAENISKHWTTSGVSTYNRPKETKIIKHKPSIKDLIRRADRPFEDIAAEFGMTATAIQRLYQEYKIMSIRRKKMGEKRGYEMQLKIFEEKGMTPPTAEQLLEWYNTLSWKDIKEKHGMERNSFMAYCGYVKCNLPPVKPMIYADSLEVRKAKSLKKREELDKAKRLVGDLLLITKESLSADVSNGMSQQEILDKYRIGKPRLKRALNEFGLHLPRRQGMNEAKREEFRQKMAKARGLPPLPSKEQLLEDIRNCSSLTEVAKKYQRTRGSITNAIRQWGMQDSIKEVNPKIYSKIQTGIETKERIRTVVFPELTKENLENDVLTLGWTDMGKKYGKAASFVKAKCREFGLLDNRPKKVCSDPNGVLMRKFRLFQGWEQKRREQNPTIPRLPSPKDFLTEMDSIGISAMERKYMRNGRTLSGYRKIIEQMTEKGILHLLEEEIVQPIASIVQAERTTNGEQFL